MNAFPTHSNPVHFDYLKNGVTEVTPFLLWKLLQKLQSAGGANLHTLAAGCAAGDGLGIVELGLDDSLEATVHQTQDALTGNLTADTDTLVAQDALALVTLDGNQALLLVAGVLGTSQTGRIDGLSVGVVDQSALLVVMAAALQAAGSLGTGLLLGEAVDNRVKVA